MKKILYLIFASAAIFASCAKDPIGNTATVNMAGEWYVTVDAIDENGEILYEDPFGMGSFLISTFNTAANTATEMFLFDNNNFCEFQVPIKADPATLTFSTDGMTDNLIYESKVEVVSGKITIGGTKTPSGVTTDAIEAVVKFDDDDFGFIYRIHGYRYSGLAADD